MIASKQNTLHGKTVGHGGLGVTTAGNRTSAAAYFRGAYFRSYCSLIRYSDQTVSEWYLACTSWIDLHLLTNLKL